MEQIEETYKQMKDLMLATAGKYAYSESDKWDLFDELNAVFLRVYEYHDPSRGQLSTLLVWACKYAIIDLRRKQNVYQIMLEGTLLNSFPQNTQDLHCRQIELFDEMSERATKVFEALTQIGVEEHEPNRRLIRRVCRRINITRDDARKGLRELRRLYKREVEALV